MTAPVAVAMSGGVDSSVAAALQVEEGRASFGVTMRLFAGEATGKSASRLPVARGSTGRCCGGDDVEIARAAAEHLGIPFFVLDVEDDFRRLVVDGFVDAYRRGRTPIPCADCNQFIKFDHLLARVRGMGAERLATGHYARVGTDGASGRRTLRRAADDDKDQTYFLFGLTQEMLERIEFPVGSLCKTEVRGVARRRQLPNADKPESQDICFVPDGDYRGFVQRMAPQPEAAGEIVDESGQVVARHQGLSHFTVGQRRGLGLGGGERRYVVALEPEANRVVIGNQEAAGTTRLLTGKVNWISRGCPPGTTELAVQVRHRQRPQPAQVEPLTDGTTRVTLRRPVVAAPGQAAVFYDGDLVAGGGWIETLERG